MASENEFEYEVALSFAGEDRSTAVKFANLLKSKQIKVFYDEDEVADLWGKDLIAHLADLYENKARYCVIFISKYYPVKSWTVFEREHIQARAFRDTHEYILPIRLDDTEVPGIAKTRAYIDIRQYPLERIANILELKLAKTKRQTSISRADQEVQTPLQYKTVPKPRIDVAAPKAEYQPGSKKPVSRARAHRDGHSSLFNSILLRTAGQSRIEDIYRNPIEIQIEWYYRTLSTLEDYLDTGELTFFTQVSLGVIKTDLLNLIRGFRKINEESPFEAEQKIYSVDRALNCLRKARNIVFTIEGMFDGDEIADHAREVFFDKIDECRQHVAKALEMFRNGEKKQDF